MPEVAAPVAALLGAVQRERVLTVTLNPALDLSTGVDRVRPRAKLRCDAPRLEPGGGGINVSRAMRILGGESTAFVALGGPTGARLLEGLREEGIEPHVWACEGDTRLSIHVDDRAASEQYRFVLPGPSQSAAAGAALLDEVVACALGGGFSIVVASGSMLPGLPVAWFATLAARMRDAGIRLIVDTSGPALAACFAGRPWLVKPDSAEWRELVGAHGPAALPDGAGMPEAIADWLLGDGLVDVVILTLGADGALLAHDGHRLRIRPPEVVVRSAVGAGDSFIGALVLGLARGWPLDEATRFGVVAAASAVTTEASELCRREQVEAFFAAAPR
ncbi:MAG: 1-phosphofructokinase family hexose kinase [Lautropia sp.]